MTTGAYRSACPMCDEVLSAASEAALGQAHVEHLTHHLTEYFEDQVAAGRAERVEYDGKTAYRIVKAAPPAAPPDEKEPRT